MDTTIKNKIIAEYEAKMKDKLDKKRLKYFFEQCIMVHDLEYGRRIFGKSRKNVMKVLFLCQKKYNENNKQNFKITTTQMLNESNLGQMPFAVALEKLMPIVIAPIVSTGNGYKKRQNLSLTRTGIMFIEELNKMEVGENNEETKC